MEYILIGIFLHYFLFPGKYPYFLRQLFRISDRCIPLYNNSLFFTQYPVIVEKKQSLDSGQIADKVQNRNSK